MTHRGHGLVRRGTPAPTRPAIVVRAAALDAMAKERRLSHCPGCGGSGLNILDANDGSTLERVGRVESIIAGSDGAPALSLLLLDGRRWKIPLARIHAFSAE